MSLTFKYVTHKHTRSKTMTPYELRFQIFNQAYAYANDEYLAAYNTVDNWNNNPKATAMRSYPEFPTYDYIEALADKINNFVSSK